MTKGKLSILIIILVLLLDQILKIWIKTTMVLGEEFSVAGNWFLIHFTENNGMAFGLEFGGEWGKLALSIFRIIAVSGIGYFIYYSIKKGSHKGFIVCMSLIFAGALGNIIDSSFYGLIFSESYYEPAVFLPEGGGYASFLHGRVVDMFYFPLFSGTFPDWVPFWGSEQFLFFRPVFNIADASITTGVITMIVFQKKFFAVKKNS